MSLFRHSSHDEGHRHHRRRRNARNLGGLVLGLAGIAVLLYLKVLAPASATLDLDFELRTPKGITAEVSHTHEVSFGGRRTAPEWRIEIKMMLKNRTGSPVVLPSARVRFQGADGERIPLRGSAFDDLIPDDAGNPLIPPGGTRSYRTAAPMRIKASGGRNVVRGTILVGDAK